MLPQPAPTARLAAAALGLAIACTAPSAAPPAATPSAAPPSGAVAVTRSLSLSVVDARYGSLSVRTEAGALCSADLQVSGGVYGDVPPGDLPEQTAGTDGYVTWSYPAPRVPAGTASFEVKCRSDAASEIKRGAFTIATRPLSASSFTVRVTAEAPPRETYEPDPLLVALRDASLEKMRATLPAEWRSATRGLGSLAVVEHSADITIFVLAGRSTSVHRRSPADDSQDILVYVSGELGPRGVENNVAVALHELGHVWCCYGPGTTDGHWNVKETSPGLYGVDKYGLMTDPVTCASYSGGVISCPNRFSDREMLALGFTEFPQPAPDPCIQQWLSLRSQIDADRAALADLRARIQAIEAQYPRGIPPSIYPSYSALVDQHNALVGQINQKVARINALPCDAS